ncbi:PilZ domain-containing protein [Qipengyuania sphaerica]|uniref:PilZ domain-containing protein n=1 Tax=Qipengyuania sphaerica TaxID=2867243 RepID=UPI001C88D59B|nr:PilZ domain-containing protein [Qipengyuania sphaerica]MBX7541631.1 PilZ domain-containing protein [Qipengyuania sphaerica]
MDFSAGFQADMQGYDGAEKRGATRYTSLIRSAKLVSGHGEFICVIRDVSSTGLSLRTFHALPDERILSLELQNGETYEITETRRNGREASYRFDRPVTVERLIHESWNFPKRQLRLNIAVPLQLSSLSGGGEAETVNLSQQGARVTCDAPFAIDQSIRVTSDSFPETRAKVRWRKDKSYGLVFENTFSLREFALMAASVQCPGLLEETPDAA